MAVRGEGSGRIHRLEVRPNVTRVFPELTPPEPSGGARREILKALTSVLRPLMTAGVRTRWGHMPIPAYEIVLFVALGLLVAGIL